MKTMWVLGIMSGTSLDSIDYALCRVSQASIELESFWQVAFPKSIKERLHRAASDRASSYEVASLDHDLGRLYARHALSGPAARRPQLAGLHGQTIFHGPAKPRAATFQLGEPAWLADVLRVPVVSNFRAADLAAGGQGAPLATLFHRLIFAQRGRHVCVNNLGGISNVTSLDWRDATQDEPDILAFDTGPANLLMDLAVRHLTNGKKRLDKNGAWAARGNVIEPLLRGWLKHPFLGAPPPKSTGRELFGEAFLERALTEMNRRRFAKEDLLATLTEFTARSIGLNYRRHLPARPGAVFFTGGGAANRVLMEKLRLELCAPGEWNGSEACPPPEVGTCEALGWPLQSIEPAAFALLAYRRFWQQPGNIPETTGATRPLILGQMTGESGTSFRIPR